MTVPKLFGFQQRNVSHSGVSLLRFNSPQILETLSVPLPNSVVYPPQFIFWSLLWWLPFTGFPWDGYSVYHRKQPSSNNLIEPYTMSTWIVDISSHLSSFTFLFRLKCLTQTKMIRKWQLLQIRSLCERPFHGFVNFLYGPVRENLSTALKWAP